MGIFKVIGNIFKRSTQNGQREDSSLPRLGASTIFTTATGGNPLNISTVYHCVDFLSSKIAALPIQYMRLKGDIYVEDKEHPLHYLLQVQPNPAMSAFDFWKMVVQYVLLRGNAYIVPVYGGELIYSSLVLLNPDNVIHNTENDTYTIVTSNLTLNEDEVIHIKNFSLDGKRGLSTLTYARLTSDIALVSDKESLNRMEVGVRGIVSNASGDLRGYGAYQDKELKKTAIDLDARFRGGERIVSLPGQTQFSPIALTSADMQFLETKKFNLRDICRFFSVSPIFVYDDSSNNYKTAELANVELMSDTLYPFLRKIELELHRKLVPRSLCCKRQFKFNLLDLLACDLDSKVKYQTSTIAAGLATVNEWRKKENKSAVEGGDTVLVSANLKSLQNLINENKQNGKGQTGIN